MTNEGAGGLPVPFEKSLSTRLACLLATVFARSFPPRRSMSGVSRFARAAGQCSRWIPVCGKSRQPKLVKGLADGGYEQAILLQAALDNMDQGLIMVAADGTVQVCNQRAIDLLNLPSQLMHSRPPFAEVLKYQFEHDEFARCDDSWRAWVTTDNRVQTPHAYERERPNGTVLEVRSVPSPGGGMVRTYTDITERKRAEEELRSAEVQLRQAQKMEAVGQLSGGIAHDFNNLLTIIAGNAELLVEELDSAETSRELAEIVLRAAERGSELTQRLLAFSRRQPLNPALTNCNKVVKGTTELLCRTLGAKIELVPQLCDEIWPVIVDQGELENALINLVVNSRDAMPNGGTITIRTENRHVPATIGSQDLPPGEYVVITVADTGIGISAEIQQRVFEPFFTTKERGKGTGLGLSTVFGFGKQSGGHVVIESNPGRGTTVRLLLPRGYGSTIDEAQKTSVPLSTRPGRILLVDDDESVRRTIASMLTSLGYRPIEAEHAAAALEIIAHEEINLLLTDVVMPGAMSGWELAIEARRQCPRLKTVVMTGYSEKAFAARQKGEAPLMDILRKPFKKEELARTLRQAFS